MSECKLDIPLNKPDEIVKRIKEILNTCGCNAVTTIISKKDPETAKIRCLRPRNSKPADS